VASRPGVWSVDVALPPGRHEYAFVMDGKRWSPDPAADRVSDDFGTESSVVVVGGEWRSLSSSL
jgi:1,4-alpha-glucan branching enzyme